MASRSSRRRGAEDGAGDGILMSLLPYKVIAQAADFWSCNKTAALLQSAEFAWRIDEHIQKALSRDDLTIRQKREMADTFTTPGLYELETRAEVKIEI